MSTQTPKRLLARRSAAPKADLRTRHLGLVTKRNSRPIFRVLEVPHRKQRYETVGDWVPGKPTEIRVSKMRDERYEFLVALHEMIEYELCKMSGVTDKEVVAFDVSFEAERRRNIHPADAEPGNDPRAPYRKEHEFATSVEMMVARRLGVRWSDYEKTLLALGPKPRRILLKPLAGRRTKVQ